MKASRAEIDRFTALLQRKQASINRLKDELAAAREANSLMSAEMSRAIADAAESRKNADLAAMWRQQAATETDTRLDPLAPSLWQRVRTWLGFGG